MKQRILQSPVIVLIDSLAITAALYLSLLARFMGDIPGQFMHYYFDLLGPAVLVHIMLFAIFGLYKIASINFKYLFRIAVTIFLSVVASYLLSTTYAPLPRSSFIIAALLVFGYVLLTRYLACRLIIITTDDDKLPQHQERRSVDHLIMSTLKSLIKTPSKVLDYFAKNTELTLLLFFSFIIRFFLAGNSSYWHDELLSVVVRGLNRSSTIDVFKYLTEHSVHPPIYEMVLYNWMKVFGHSELATRSLSSLYVVFAVLFVYLFVEKLYNQKTAFTAALFFSLSFIALYYSLETRYYAQVLLMSSLSSYSFALFINSTATNFCWKKLFINKYYAFLVIANLLLLLSHYYTYMFIAAQGIFFAIYVSINKGFGNIGIRIVKVLSIYLMQVLIFIIVWGRPLFNTINRFKGGNYDVAGLPSLNIIDFYLDYIFLPNMNFTPALFGFLLVMIILAFYNTLYGVKHLKEFCNNGGLLFLYCVSILVAVPIIAFVSFYLIQLERYSLRYFVFCTPPLMILLSVVLYSGLKGFSDIFQHIIKIQLWKIIKNNYIIISLLTCIILILPNGYSGATKQMHNWGDIAQQVVNLINSNPEYNYVILETSPRNDKLFNYHLSQISRNIEVFNVIQRYEERRISEGDSEYTFNFEANKHVINEYDYLILVFTHERERSYPNAIARLSSQFDLLYRQTNHMGRGYIVFEINGNNR